MSASQLESEVERLENELKLVEEAMDTGATAARLVEEISGAREPMILRDGIENPYLAPPPRPGGPCPCCTIL